MLYLLEDTTFVSNAAPALTALNSKQEQVQQRWKRLSKSDIVKLVQQRMSGKTK
jgi:hypothetical protein